MLDRPAARLGRFSPILAALCLLTSVVAGSTRADQGDWSSFAGDGTFSVPATGLRLIEQPSEARLAWQSGPLTGLQKTNKAGDGEFYGGTACVVVGDGMVFTSFIRPSGEVLNEKRVNRYYPLEKQPTSLRQIDADDVTVAYDAETGKLLWTAGEKGRGMNFLFGKRGHYGVTPAYGAGMVFAWGTLGDIYAYDARTGAKKWEAKADAFHEKALAAKTKALADRTILDTYGSAPLFEDLRTGLVVVDDVLVTPDGLGGLIGLETGTGQKRWQLPSVIARGATPAIWRHAGRAYLLCPGGSKNQGKISLVSSADGKIQWTHTHEGPAHTSLVIGNDRTFFNTRGNMNNGQQGPKGDKKLGSGLLACYQLTLEGPKPLWTLEDVPENWHNIRPDRGMNRRIAIRGDTGFLLVGTEQKLVTVDMPTGRVIQRDQRALPGTACSPVVVEDRLFVPLDLAHSWGSVTIAVYSLDDKGGFAPIGDIDVPGQLKAEVLTDYEVANEFAWWKGRFFTKTRAGVAAIDVRKP